MFITCSLLELTPQLFCICTVSQITVQAVISVQDWHKHSMCLFTLASSRVRKSNCVKEVEKIQQRRIERRAAQQVRREQQEQECDMSVPTWEFAAMIRYRLHDSSASALVVTCTFCLHFYSI